MDVDGNAGAGCGIFRGSRRRTEEVLHQVGEPVAGGAERIGCIRRDQSPRQFPGIGNSIAVVVDNGGKLRSTGCLKSRTERDGRLALERDFSAG